MKHEKIINKIVYISVFISAITFILYVINIGKTSTELYENGIETTGIVIDKGSGGQRPRLYFIRFEYELEGEKISVHSTIYAFDEYRDAVIGGKYVVRYLHDSPQDAQIYIKEPVLELKYDSEGEYWE